MHPGMEVAQGHAQPHSSIYIPSAPPTIHSVSPMTRVVGPSFSPAASGSLIHKLEELSKRLRQCPEDLDTRRWWWDRFACEFFDENATMIISFFSPSEGDKNYTIGRAMIPQYFNSIFEGGVTEMYFTFSLFREYMTAAGPTLECDSAITTTQYSPPSCARVLVESKISIHCAFDECMRIRSWHQYLLRHKEYIPRDMLTISLQESGAVDSLLPNITHLGINGFTHRFLNVSAIADSVRPDMKRSGYGMLPDNCMQSWSNNHPDPLAPTSCMMSHPLTTQPLCPSLVDFSQSPVLSTTTDSLNSSDRIGGTKSPKPAKKQKRVRKATTPKEASAPSKKASKLNSSNSTPTLPCPHPLPQDVMVVGEPVLMSSELGNEDERCITRLENNSGTDLFVHGQHAPIIPTIYNGNGNTAGDLALRDNGEIYDEPSITAALDALEQDAIPLSLP